MATQNATIYPQSPQSPQSQRRPSHSRKIPLSHQILLDIKNDLRRLKKSQTSTFRAFPKHVTFETQETEEEIILLLRRHVITNISWVLVVAMMAIAPFLFVHFPLFDQMPGNFWLFTIILWYLFTVAAVFEKFLSWYFNVYIVTDERVVDVDFFSLIYKRISDAKIDKIQDVSYSQGGFIQSIFDYGNIRIQTAAELAEFEFEYIPNPSEVTKVINQLISQEEQEKIEGRVR